MQAAGLVDALQGEGPFTVFAPTDAAFAKLPEGTVETLLKPENKDQLISILKFHVVSGSFTAREALKTSGVKTLQGQQLSLDIRNAKAVVNDATIIATDVQTSNGVIHIIDSVLIPN